MRTGIVWFTNDLRTGDNAVLSKAVQTCDHIIPLYVFSTDLLQINSYGFQNQGYLRSRFVFESLLDLDQSLRLKQSGLVFKMGPLITCILELVKQYKVDVVYTQSPVAVDEVALQQTLRKALKSLHCELIDVNNHSLYQASELPFELSRLPKVFTAFRQQVEAVSIQPNLIQAPDTIPSPSIPTLQLPDLNEHYGQFDVNHVVVNRLMRGGQTAGQKRLHTFVFDTKAIQHYKDNRNALDGDIHFSKLSPYLSVGCLSAKQVYHAVKQFEQTYVANDSTYWLLFELLWRDFFYFSMQQEPTKYFLRSGLHDIKPMQPHLDKQVLNSWCKADTSNDLINALMTELNCTGFMSNRGRQIVASYLCHDLGLDWRFGAAYFQQQLIDFDVSSNWCNWAYIAGVGNNPRGKSHFNIQKQAAQFDADDAFRQLWLKHSI